MAVALTPAGLKTIAIADGPDDSDAAKLLQEELLASGALAYAAAYVSLKLDSPAVAEAESRGQKLDGRVKCLEASSSPFHRLLASKH
ncbi:hypothetical protein GOB57_21995 [Sinorhizobium meliloti]|nr:hypothetical protein [Sinorhizobium meliloti]